MHRRVTWVVACACLGAGTAQAGDLRETTWAFTDGSTVVYEADGTVRRGWGEPRVGQLSQKGDEATVTFGDEVHEIRLLDGCHMTHYEPPADKFWFASRTNPECNPDEIRYAGLANTLWLFADGERLVIGDKLASRSWGDAQAGTSTVRGDEADLVFGSESVTVRALDGCHLLYPAGDDMWPAKRAFPACGPAICTHTDLEWATWGFSDGTVMQLKPDGAAWRSWGPQTGTWKRTAEGFVTTFGEAQVAFTLSGCDVSATVGDQQWSATKTWPTCGCTSP